MYALTNCVIYTTESILVDHAVIVEDEVIKAIIPINELPSDTRCIDLNGDNLTPGFIDLQLNGCGGVMFNGAETQQTLLTMQAANLKSGTTSYLPTFITDSDERMKKALDVVRDIYANNR